MDQLLQGFPDTHCILDDILITGVDDEHHLANVEAVLQRLEDAGLRANRQKCSFLQPRIDNCGHEISEDGLHKMPSKVDAFRQAPVPANISQLRSFLGLANYCARFLPNFSTALHPLNTLLQKEIAWRWTAACHQAFDKVKQQIATDLVLTHFNLALPLRLASDASPYGIGAVMSHVLPNGIERPITFASRTLLTAERDYAQINKEALAIIWAVRKFHTYFYGRDFVLVTDHKPLTAIFNPERDLPALNVARLQRCALFLSGTGTVSSTRTRTSTLMPMDPPACNSLGTQRVIQSKSKKTPSTSRNSRICPSLQRRSALLPDKFRLGHPFKGFIHQKARRKRSTKSLNPIFRCATPSTGRI